MTKGELSKLIELEAKKIGFEQVGKTILERPIDYEENEKELFDIPHAVMPYTVQDIMEMMEGKQLVQSVVNRSLSWKTNYKRDVIDSIIHGIPIGAMHFVKVAGQEIKKEIVDASNRCDAIHAFQEGKFKIKFQITSDGKYALPKGKISKVKEYKDFSWKEILEKADLSKTNHDYDIFASLSERIRKYNGMSVMVWEPMSDDLKAILFKKINRSVPPNNDENNYCEHFRMKALLEYILTSYVGKYSEATKEYGGIISHGQRSLKINGRFVTYRFIHNILYYTFGESFRDVKAERSLSLKEMTKSAAYFHKFLGELKIKKSDDITKEIIQELGIDKSCELLQKTVEIIDYVFRAQGVENMKMDKNILRDIIIFSMSYMRTKKISRSSIEEEYGKYYELFLEYNRKIGSGGTKSQSTLKNTITDRSKIFDALFNESGIKVLNEEVNISKTEEYVMKKLAVGKICPVSKEVMRDGDIQLDHVEPKSKDSTVHYDAISSTGNRQKSNITEQNIDRLSEYYQKHHKDDEIIPLKNPNADLLFDESGNVV